MKFALFSPVSAVWEHAQAEYELAKHLRLGGHHVEQIFCDGMVRGGCSALGPLRIDAKAPAAVLDSVCRSCKRRRSLLEDQIRDEVRYLDDFLNDEYAPPSIEHITQETWSEFDYEGQPLGRIAAYELALKYKLSNHILDSEQLAEYRVFLEATLRTFDAALAYLRTSQPDVVVVYNELYAVPGAFVAAARKLGVRTYTIQGGPHNILRHSTLTISRSAKALLSAPISSAWQEEEPLHPTSEGLALAESHFSDMMLGRGTFAYSTGAKNLDVQRLWGLDHRFPIILAVTSSDDEIFAASLVEAMPQTSAVRTYGSQLEWIAELLQFAQRNPSYQVIIRIHPRLFPNKRDGRESSLGVELRRTLSVTPPNVIVNWPEDGVSLYDIMRIADLGITFRSTAGLEMLLVGIPVVAASNPDFVAYPIELNAVYKSSSQLDDCVARALKNADPAVIQKRALAWVSFLFTRTSIPIGRSTISIPTRLRPTKPGRSLRVWNSLVSLIVRYGPPIRESNLLKSALRDFELNEGIIRLMVNDHETVHSFLLREYPRPKRADESLMEEVASRFRKLRGKS